MAAHAQSQLYTARREEDFNMIRATTSRLIPRRFEARDILARVLCKRRAGVEVDLVYVRYEYRSQLYIFAMLDGSKQRMFQAQNSSYPIYYIRLS